MTRSLDKKCPTCGGDKEMYYTLWCPKCERPEVKTTHSLNFLQVIRHIERKHEDIVDVDTLKGHKATLWDFISERISNDSYVALCLKMQYEERCDPDEDGRYLSYDGREDYTKAYEMIKLILDEYDDGSIEGDFDNILWEISW